MLKHWLHDAKIQHLSQHNRYTWARSGQSRYSTQWFKAFRKLAPMDTRSIRSPLRHPRRAPIQQAAGEIKTLPLVLKTAACPAVARERRFLPLNAPSEDTRKPSFISLCTKLSCFNVTAIGDRDITNKFSIALFFGNCVREFHLRTLKNYQQWILYTQIKLAMLRSCYVYK